MDFKEMLSKPWRVSLSDGTERLVVIYNVNTSTGSHKDPLSGEIIQTEDTIIHVIDVDESIKTNLLRLEYIPVIDPDFINKFSEVDESECRSELDKVYILCYRELSELHNDILNVTQAMGSLSPINAELLEFIQDKDEIINLNIRDAFQAEALNDQEIQLLIQNIIRSMLHHIDEFDVDNPEELDELEDIIKLEIFNTLPNSVSIEDIELKMDKIAEIFKDMRRQIEEDDESEDSHGDNHFT